MRQHDDRPDLITRRRRVRSWRGGGGRGAAVGVEERAPEDSVGVDAERTADPVGASRRPTWQLVVSAVLIVFIGAQLFAGWKFLNDQTYPIVGSAMFNSPPIPGSNDFLVPRVIGTTAAGGAVELDQHTFGLESFEWRAWIIDNLERVDRDVADATARALAAAFTRDTGERLVTLELWRVPARTDDFDPAYLVRTVDL